MRPNNFSHKIWFLEFRSIMYATLGAAQFVIRDSLPKTASTASLKLPFRLICTSDFIDLLVKQIFPGNSFQLMKSSLFIIWVFFVIYVNFTLFTKFWPSVYQVKAREPWLEIQLLMRMTQLDWSLGLVAKFFDQNYQNLLQKFNFFSK